VSPAGERTRVDVGIPTYGQPRYLAEAIECVLAQSLASWRLTISENGTGSSEIAAAVAPYLSDHRVRHVVTGANLGGPRNASRLINTGSAEYVAILHDDDLWEADFLRRRVEFLDANPSCGLVFCDCWMVDSAGTRLPGLGFGASLESGVQDRRAFFARLYEGNMIGIPTALVRRSAYEAVGAEFRDDLLFYDHEIWLRLAARFDVGFLDDVAASYRVHAGQTTQQEAQRLAAHRLALLDAVDESLPDDFSRLHRRRAWSRAYLSESVAAGRSRKLGRSLALFAQALHAHPWVLVDPWIASTGFLSVRSRVRRRRAWKTVAGELGS
jgi:glycosyltransferase involved in cell wall biosynthesis